MKRLLALLLLCGCPADDRDPATGACDLLDEDATRVEAGPFANDTAPEVELGAPFEVALPGGSASYVRWVVQSEFSALVFVDAEGAIGGLHRDGAEQDLPPTFPNASCEGDLPEHVDVDVGPGTWHIEFTASAPDPVRLVITDGEGHAVDR